MAFEKERLKLQLAELFTLCTSVIVYRSSPDDKAKTISHVMSVDPTAFTLAIGDGANDVNMI